MKEYNSPICEITIISMSDIITDSNYDTLNIYDNGDLDSGSNKDVIYW